MKNQRVTSLVGISVSFLVLVLILIAGSVSFPAAQTSMFCNDAVAPEHATQKVKHSQNFRGIEGYLSSDSYEIGEEIVVFAHTNDTDFDLTIKSLVGNKVFYFESDIPGIAQAIPECALSEGAHWLPTFSVEVGKWPSAIYVIELQDRNGTTAIPFVVSSGTKDTSEITVLANTYTWQAYNSWGGGNLYEWERPSAFALGGPSPFCRQDAFFNFCSQTYPIPSLISLNRPNSNQELMNTQSHLVGGEKHLYSLFETNSIEYSVISDGDLDNVEGILDNTQTLVLNSHPEYWTESMISKLDRFLKSGGNVIYLGGNAIYWKTVSSANQLEVMKDGSRHTLADTSGGLWSSNGFHASSLLGVGYSGAGYGTQAPFTIVNSNHWVFDGTDLAHGDHIGTHSSTNSPWPFNIFVGGSGWETDKVDQQSPQNIVLLARGLNPTSGGADMTIFETAAGGSVFSAGSLTFPGTIDQDANIQRIILNVVNEFLAG